jgi:hypothetical protein
LQNLKNNVFLHPEIGFIAGLLKKYTIPLRREENYSIVYQYFPLLFKEGCHARRVMTGWLISPFQQPLEQSPGKGYGLIVIGSVAQLDRATAF